MGVVTIYINITLKVPAQGSSNPQGSSSRFRAALGFINFVKHGFYPRKQHVFVAYLIKYVYKIDTFAGK
jgi:hypothetical protein